MSEYRGHNVRRWPHQDEMETGQGYVTLAVLREGPDGWRCYQAIVKDPYPDGDKEYTEAIEWTSAHGNKIDPVEALVQFPGLAKDVKWAR